VRYQHQPERDADVELPVEAGFFGPSGSFFDPRWPSGVDFVSACGGTSGFFTAGTSVVRSPRGGSTTDSPAALFGSAGFVGLKSSPGSDSGSERCRMETSCSAGER
jgi:hypothetical protein